jgi:DNA-binding response OmpR family regulator
MTNNNNKKRILLVDDEYDITVLFNMVLEEFGFAVDSFNDPLLALSSFKAGLYNMAILDVRMPKTNGFELGCEIRKLDNNVMISFLSAFDICEENLKVTVPSLYGEKLLVIRKPISIDDFILRIKEKLE